MSRAAWVGIGVSLGVVGAGAWLARRAQAETLGEGGGTVGGVDGAGDDVPTVSAPSSAATRSPLLEFGRPVPAGVMARVSSGWARPRGNRLHRALDLPIPVGTPIVAVDAGEVIRVQRADRGDAGIWVGIRHPSGVTSRYLHLSEARARRGQVVRRGEVIGLSGNTGHSSGPHLHLDLRVPRAMLDAITNAVGMPRTGWGPAMEPYGHSIPGEPWIPVDHYREDVRREAAAAGIPLFLARA